MLEMELNKESSGGLTLREYQRRAMGTCLRESENFAYMFMNLVGELGEFASKIAKQIRKGRFELGQNEVLPVEGAIGWDDWKAIDDELELEAGDLLWQLSGLCSVMDWDLEGVAMKNLEKLASRKRRGKIDGEGDMR